MGFGREVAAPALHLPVIALRRRVPVTGGEGGGAVFRAFPARSFATQL